MGRSSQGLFSIAATQKCRTAFLHYGVARRVRHKDVPSAHVACASQAQGCALRWVRLKIMLVASSQKFPGTGKFIFETPSIHAFRLGCCSLLQTLSDKFISSCKIVMAYFAIKRAVSNIRLAKPHSLSNHTSSFSNLPPLTRVCVASTTPDLGSWLKSI